jgi:hypothetical protein
MKKILILILLGILSIGVYAKKEVTVPPQGFVNSLLDSLSNQKELPTYIIRNGDMLDPYNAYIQLKAKYPPIGNETRVYSNDVICACRYSFKNGTIVFYDSNSEELTGVLEITHSKDIEKDDVLKGYPEHFFILFFHTPAKK